MAIKFENNYLDKSLENLEKSVWPAIEMDDGSHLIRTCNNLRKKQLKNYSVEDLRIMIGQDIGLRFIVPLAITILKDAILAEGDLYAGDLLKSVLTSDLKYWRENTDSWKTVCTLVEENTNLLNESDTSFEIKKAWFEAYKKFKLL